MKKELNKKETEIVLTKKELMLQKAGIVDELLLKTLHTHLTATIEKEEFINGVKKITHTPNYPVQEKALDKGLRIRNLLTPDGATINNETHVTYVWKDSNNIVLPSRISERDTLSSG